MSDLFDDGEESRVDMQDEKADLDIKQAQESSADSDVELKTKTFTPQKLEGSKPHEFLTRDSILSNLKDDLDVALGTQYHALACYLQWMEMIESAQFVDSVHTSWLDHTVGKDGFGRRLLTTTSIDRTQKVIKQPEQQQTGMVIK